VESQQPEAVTLESVIPSAPLEEVVSSVVKPAISGNDGNLELRGAAGDSGSEHESGEENNSDGDH
jgi:hypothetical protein